MRQRLYFLAIQRDVYFSFDLTVRSLSTSRCFYAFTCILELIKTDLKHLNPATNHHDKYISNHIVIQVEPLKYTLINALLLLEIDDFIVYNTINRMNRQAVTNKSSKIVCVIASDMSTCKT